MPTRAGRRKSKSAILRSACPISGALDLLGDRWTLLVMRDVLFYEKKRFADFLASPERIASNILADRLKRLEQRGLIERRRYSERPPREEYRATARGTDLIPALRELIRWGQRHVPGTAKRPPAGVPKRTLRLMGVDPSHPRDRRRKAR